MGKVSTSWKKGQSGNPKGAPQKEWTMKGLIKQSLEEMTATGKPKNQLVAEKLSDLALSGDMNAIKEINNRVDGMSKQSLEVEGEIRVPGVWIPKEEK